MRIAVLSDLHIGARARSDAFLHARDRFLALLDDLEATHDRIVLLGDVFQCDQGGWVGEAAEHRELNLALERVAWLSERISRPIYTYVHGNHDSAAVRVLGAVDELLLGDGGFRVLLLHGHQWDPVLGSTPAATRIATWFSGVLRLLGLCRLASWLEDWDVALKARAWAGEDGPYVRGARERLRARDAHVVVMGHTHVAARHDLPEGIVANAGSCAGGRVEYVSIDTSTRSVTLHPDPRARP